MEEIKEMLKAVINGQHALRSEVKQEIQNLRQEMNDRFKNVDKRFDEVDKRFDEVGNLVAIGQGDAIVTITKKSD